MVTYFNKKDLVNFGRYLLSDERTLFITKNYNPDDNISLQERLTEIYQHDVDNFLKINNGN